MIRICFDTLYGYKVHIVMFVVTILMYVVDVLVERITGTAKGIKRIPPQIHMVLFLVELLTIVHGIFYTIGENITFGQGAFSRVGFEGWMGYLIIFVILLVILKSEYGKPNIRLNNRYNIGLICIVISGVLLSNLINVFSAGETCGLMCEDFTCEIIEWICDNLFGGKCFWYIATNVLIPMALTTYVVVMISLCAPRMSEDERKKSIKQFKVINSFAFVLMVYYLLYDMLVTMRSGAYLPMIVVNRVVQVALTRLEDVEKNTLS